MARHKFPIFSYSTNKLSNAANSKRAAGLPSASKNVIRSLPAKMARWYSAPLGHPKGTSGAWDANDFRGSSEDPNFKGKILRKFGIFSSSAAINLINFPKNRLLPLLPGHRKSLAKCWTFFQSWWSQHAMIFQNVLHNYTPVQRSRMQLMFLLVASAWFSWSKLTDSCFFSVKLIEQHNQYVYISFIYIYLFRYQQIPAPDAPNNDHGHFSPPFWGEVSSLWDIIQCWLMSGSHFFLVEIA